ncbi:hypothetical protein KUTeg_017111 [Tegillarca granosa]|uniref:Uncharacterized protein n=1 Tax=Tegillarca granosa TaxID=220873 RepID=A0ABQ9ERL4_TEGGR|nr:hypothetical protein KUTeg_017111 [Tegillarca granosa]
MKTLNLRGNKIYEICNLENCQQLWNLDISNNQIKSLDGLARYIALGTLNLANNDLSWHELGKIRNMHILNLYLHGNSYLEKDPYYCILDMTLMYEREIFTDRLHVIDCLPNVWMLDGRIITCKYR